MAVKYLVDNESASPKQSGTEASELSNIFHATARQRSSVDYENLLSSDVTLLLVSFTGRYRYHQQKKQNSRIRGKTKV